jgi:hypothetical protein
MTQADRRKNRRLALRLPVEYRIMDLEEPGLERTVCRDISTSGISFDTDCSRIAVGTTLAVDLIVPPGDGYFPYAGRVSSRGEVVRVEPAPVADDATATTPVRFRVAARFKDAPTLNF